MLFGRRLITVCGNPYCMLIVLRKEMGERDREPEDFMFKVWSFMTGSYE